MRNPVNKILIIVFAVLGGFQTLGWTQIDDFQFRREISGINGDWNQLYIPEEVFKSIRPDFADLRVFGVNITDTVQAPYIIKGRSIGQNNAFERLPILNSSRQGNDYFFTIQNENKESIQSLWLDFGNQNFDWRLQLEGSHDEKDWFTILENYRVVAFKKGTTDFNYSELKFPLTNFPYLKVKVPSQEQPLLSQVRIKSNSIWEPEYSSITNFQQEINHSERERTTTIYLKLANPVPLVSINIEVLDSFDYFRPVQIAALTDSLERENGFTYLYESNGSGILSSNQSNQVSLKPIISNQFRITIYNQDNEPLRIGNVKVNRLLYSLVFRTNRRDIPYYFYYGNPDAISPNYDISRFLNNIPESPNPVKLKEEEILLIQTENRSFSINPMVLWGVMIIIILVLGWFSIDLLRKNK